MFTNAGRACRLEQSVALPKHAFIVGNDGAHSRSAQHEKLVEKLSATRRFPADDDEILRCEQNARKEPGKFSRLDRGPIHLRAVCARAIELYFCENFALEMRESSPHNGRILALPNHRVIGRYAMRAEGAQVPERLDEIGLSLPVASDEKVGSAVKIDFEGLVVSKVAETEVRDDHEWRADQLLRTAWPPN